MSLHFVLETMDNCLMLILLLTTCCGKVFSVTVTGKITEDRSFYYRKFPAPPSKSAKIEYINTFSNDYVDLHMYTTEDHINIEKKSSFVDYGQLRNSFMNKQLSQGFTGCRPVNNQTKCGWDDRYQDYIPRNFGFSFGFKCQDVPTKSLRGLSYSLTINYRPNDTKCEPIPDNTPFNCTQYYKLATFLNLLDQQELDRVAIDLRDTLDLVNHFIGDLSKIDCYQHLMEVFCFLYFPKCDSMNNASPIMIPPCEESIMELQKGCQKWLTHLPAFLLWQKFNLVTLGYNPDYLPSKNVSIPCF